MGWESFIAWHESVIAQYPPSIQRELRDSRTKWLQTVRNIKESP